MDSDDDSILDSLPIEPALWPEAARSAVDHAVANGVPSDVLALFARWWQLETWLRLLIYLELRAQKGLRWSDTLPMRGRHLAERDSENAYMASADASNLLAYLDSGELLGMLGSEEVWPIVEFALLKRNRWDGLVDELKSIRNRNAHLRRPHRDDLARVNQALRNLEPGARAALEAFNRQQPLPRDPLDPLARAWVAGEHEDAQTLVKHAERQYDTAFHLSYSKRPWTSPQGGMPISCQKGVLLHANWYLRGGAAIRPRDFWADGLLDVGGTRDLIVLVTCGSDAQVTVTFSAADSPTPIADAIGRCFEAVLNARDRSPTVSRRRRWLLDAANLDWRVHVNTALLVATEDQPFSVFGE